MHEFLNDLEQVVVNMIDAVVELQFLCAVEYNCLYRFVHDSRSCAILFFIYVRIALPFAVQ